MFYILCFCSLAFKLLESSGQRFLQGLVYLIGNLLGLALAVYKCQSMGLLPTHASDWLAFIEPTEVGLHLQILVFHVKMCCNNLQLHQEMKCSAFWGLKNNSLKSL